MPFLLVGQYFGTPRRLRTARRGCSWTWASCTSCSPVGRWPAGLVAAAGQAGARQHLDADWLRRAVAEAGWSVHGQEHDGRTVCRRVHVSRTAGTRRRGRTRQWRQRGLANPLSRCVSTGTRSGWHHRGAAWTTFDTLATVAAPTIERPKPHVAAVVGVWVLMLGWLVVLCGGTYRLLAGSLRSFEHSDAETWHDLHQGGLLLVWLAVLGVVLPAVAATIAYTGGLRRTAGWLVGLTALMVLLAVVPGYLGVVDLHTGHPPPQPSAPYTGCQERSGGDANCPGG